VVVHCSPAQQLARLTARDGLSADEALARVRSQMSIGEKRAGPRELRRNERRQQLSRGAPRLRPRLEGTRRRRAAADPARERQIPGLRAPGGRHRVDVEYHPLGLGVGVAVSLLSAALVAKRAPRVGAGPHSSAQARPIPVLP
jgi:hypothetical protein